MFIVGMDWRVLLVESSIVGLICGFVYWLTKVAIREGIKESGLVEALRRLRPPPDEKLPDWADKD